MKVRVIQKDNTFIPQWKGWLFWHNYTKGAKIIVRYSGLDAAISFLEARRLIRQRNGKPSKATVWTGNI